MDQPAEKPDRLTHPRHRADLPEVGVFCARGSERPVVELLKHDKNVLTVLDAYDGTPVLDIEPHHPISGAGVVYDRNWPLNTVNGIAAFVWDYSFRQAVSRAGPNYRAPPRRPTLE
jgi:tRNA (Thr-GGU) A37 N-methylase